MSSTAGLTGGGTSSSAGVGARDTSTDRARPCTRCSDPVASSRTNVENEYAWRLLDSSSSYRSASTAATTTAYTPSGVRAMGTSSNGGKKSVPASNRVVQTVPASSHPSPSITAYSVPESIVRVTVPPVGSPLTSPTLGYTAVGKTSTRRGGRSGVAASGLVANSRLASPSTPAGTSPSYSAISMSTGGSTVTCSAAESFHGAGSAGPSGVVPTVATMSTGDPPVSSTAVSTWVSSTCSPSRRTPRSQLAMSPHAESSTSTASWSGRSTSTIATASWGPLLPTVTVSAKVSSTSPEAGSTERLT